MKNKVITHFAANNLLYFMCLLYMGCLIVVGNAFSPSKHFIIPFRKTQTQTLLELKLFSASLNSRRKANYHSSRNRIRTRLSLSSSTLEGNKSVGENYNNVVTEKVAKQVSTLNACVGYKQLQPQDWFEQEKIIKNAVTEKVAKQVSTLNACVGYKELQPQDWFINQDVSSNSVLVSKIDLLYDSECPICMMEVSFLQKRDINDRIRFTDLSDPSYNPAEHGNVQFADGMRKLRAVLPNGRVITGMEVFRETYEAIGLGWVFHLTRMPVIHEIADTVYDIWAENRLKITGRQDLAELLKERRSALEDIEPIEECDLDACGIDFDDLEAELAEKGI